MTFDKVYRVTIKYKKHLINAYHIIYETFNSTKNDILGLTAASTAYSGYQAGDGLGVVVQCSTNIGSVYTLNRLEAMGENYLTNSKKVEGRFGTAMHFFLIKDFILVKYWRTISQQRLQR